MNAYQVLGIVLQENMSEQEIDNKISEKVTQILKKQIIEIKKIIENNNIDEKTKVDKISNSVSSAMNIVVSYLNICSKSEREKYNQNGKANIAQLVEKMKSAVRFSGKTAYQIAGIVRNTDALKNTDINNEKACKNIYSMYFLAIKNLDIDSLQSILRTIMNMEKYAWAYSKINTSVERENYEISLDEEEHKEEYHALRKKGTEKIKEIEVTRKFNKVHPWNYVLKGEFENKYRAMQISHIGTIEYGSKFIINENEIKEYEITKQKNNGEVVQETIFTNIDYVKLQESEEYRNLISNVLLTDSKIHMGKKYLSGYIGSIDKDNNVEYDIEDAAVCIKWQNHLNEEKDDDSKQFED